MLQLKEVGSPRSGGTSEAARTETVRDPRTFEKEQSGKGQLEGNGHWIQRSLDLSRHRDPWEELGKLYKKDKARDGAVAATEAQSMQEYQKRFGNDLNMTKQ